MDVYGHLYEDKKEEVALRLENLWTATKRTVDERVAPSRRPDIKQSTLNENHNEL
jgi:hypothetical protein